MQLRLHLIEMQEASGIVIGKNKIFIGYDAHMGV